MSYADSITAEQKVIIQSWADAGDDLSLIQKKLAAELEVQVTYMEVRFLIGDLGIVMPSKEVPVEEEAEEEVVSEKAPAADDGAGGEEAGGEEAGSEEQSAQAEPQAELPAGADQALPAASVTVTMSEVLPPGAMAGGTVVFSDGVNANWSLNQMGQLSLDASDPAYRPSEADVAAFQKELQKLAQEKGL